MGYPDQGDEIAALRTKVQELAAIPVPELVALVEAIKDYRAALTAERGNGEGYTNRGVTWATVLNCLNALAAKGW